MSVREYNNMLYRDFILKMQGYKERQEYEEEISRTIAFSAYIAPHLNVKKMAKNIEKFWPMKKGGDTKKISDARRKAIQKALREDNIKKAQEQDGSKTGN